MQGQGIRQRLSPQAVELKASRRRTENASFQRRKTELEHEVTLHQAQHGQIHLETLENMGVG